MSKINPYELTNAALKESRSFFYFIPQPPLHITSICLMRASAVEGDGAHNPEVVGSNPTPATNFILDRLRISVAFFHSYFLEGMLFFRQFLNHLYYPWIIRVVIKLDRITMCRS